MKRTKIFLATFFAFLVCGSAVAVPITFTGSGTGSDGALSASATLSLVSSTQLQLTLTNTLAATLFRSQGQALSNFEFNLSGGTITGLGNGGAGTGTLINIGSGGSVTPTGSSIIPAGQFALNTNVNAGGTTFQFQLTALAGGQPDYMIAPNANSFPNANPGGLTNGNFNPFVQGTATFFLNGTGFTNATTISLASFSFGTGPDTFVPGVPGNQIPDNGQTLTLLGAALAGLEVLRRLTLKRSPAA